MSESDVEALLLLIKYSEEEAIRLALSSTIINHLRMAKAELAKSMVDTPATARVGQRVH